jgi:hypothetical protein
VYQLFPNRTSHDQLSEDDFNALISRSVAESQYVEFKRDVPDNKKVAKTIAAFANSHGGWLVLGVEELSGGLAGACVGIDVGKHSDLSGFIRNICRDLIAPFPNHYVREVKMGNGRSLVAIEVPKSVDTPHICSDGTIPIRVGGSTKGIDVHNHHEIGKLVERANEFRKEYLHFAKDERYEASEFQYSPCLSIYIWPVQRCELIFDLTELIDTDGLRNAKDALNARLPIAIWEGVKAMHDADEPELDIPSGESQVPFDSTYFHGDSLYFEQGSRNGLFCRVDLGGRFRAHIPLSIFRNVSTAPMLQESGRRYLKKSLSDGYEGFFDAATVWHTSSHLISLYLLLLKNGSEAGFRVSMVLDNVAGLIPYVNIDEWAAHVSQCGVAKFHAARHAMPSSKTTPYLLAKDPGDLRSASVWLSSLIFGIPNNLMWAGWTDYLERSSSGSVGTR